MSMYSQQLGIQQVGGGTPDLNFRENAKTSTAKNIFEGWWNNYSIAYNAEHLEK